MPILHVRADRFAHQRADGQVGHVVVVHHVEMHQVGAGGLDGAHLLAQAGKVGGQDGRGDAREVGGRVKAFMAGFQSDGNQGGSKAPGRRLGMPGVQVRQRHALQRGQDAQRAGEVVVGGEAVGRDQRGQPGRQGRPQPVGRVLESQAAGGRQLQPRQGLQIDLRMRLLERRGGGVLDHHEIQLPVRADGRAQQRGDVDRRGRGGNRQAQPGLAGRFDQPQHAGAQLHRAVLHRAFIGGGLEFMQAGDGVAHAGAADVLQVRAGPGASGAACAPCRPRCRAAGCTAPRPRASPAPLAEKAWLNAARCALSVSARVPSTSKIRACSSLAGMGFFQRIGGNGAVVQPR